MTVLPLALACGLLGACAQPAVSATEAMVDNASTNAAAAEEPTQRLLLRTVADWPSTAALAEQVAKATGSRVGHISTVAPRLFGLTLTCDSATLCAQAQARLAAQQAWVAEVLPDERRGLPRRPAPSTTP